MSLNIQTISDKAEFTNYFTDPMTIPKNAEIVNTKTSLALPIMVSPSVRVPPVPAPYTDIAITVIIDGVSVDITWQDIYTAHTEFTASGQSIDDIVNGSQADYFGKYRFYPNDNVIWLAQNKLAPHEITEKFKISFNQVLAQAINTKFKFYTVFQNPEYKTSDYLTIDRSGTTTTALINATTGQPIIATPISAQTQQLTKFGFTTQYDPQKMTNGVEDFITINPADITNWDRDAVDTKKITSTVTGMNVAFLSTGDGDIATIDPNGGFISTRINHSSGKMAWGLILVGEGENDKFDSNYLNAGGTTIDNHMDMIDIGFVIEENAGGNKVITIIDGLTRTVVYGGATIENRTMPNLKPTQPIMGYNNNSDKLYIQIKRGTVVNGNSEFIFSLFHGDGSPIDDTNDQLIYVSKQTFSGGRIKPTPCFLSDNVAGNVFDLVASVKMDEQSEKQGAYFTDLQLSSGGQNVMGTISLLPNLSASNDNVDLAGSLYKFWKSYGFDNPKNANLSDNTDVQFFTGFGGSDLQNVIQLDTNFIDANTNYWIGNNSVSAIYQLDEDAGGKSVVPIGNNPLSSLPQQLDISINNMDIKNYVGAFVSATLNNPSNSLSRVVGTVPIDITQVNETMIINLQYEPFNLVYRPINNPNPFNLNELKIEIFYRDMQTNQRRIIENIFGVINLEFNIRGGYNPKKPVNNLLPY